MESSTKSLNEDVLDIKAGLVEDDAEFNYKGVMSAVPMPKPGLDLLKVV